MLQRPVRARLSAPSPGGEMGGVCVCVSVSVRVFWCVFGHVITRFFTITQTCHFDSKVSDVACVSASVSTFSSRMPLCNV